MGATIKAIADQYGPPLALPEGALLMSATERWMEGCPRDLRPAALPTELRPPPEHACQHDFGLAGECVKCHAVERIIVGKGSVSALRARIAELEAEVARLKDDRTPEQRAAHNLNVAYANEAPFPARAFNPPAHAIGLKTKP